MQPPCLRGLGVVPSTAVRPCLFSLLPWPLSVPRLGFPFPTERLLLCLIKLLVVWRVGMTLKNNVGTGCRSLLIKVFVPCPIFAVDGLGDPRGLPQLQGTADLTLVVGDGSSVSWAQ